LFYKSCLHLVNLKLTISSVIIFGLRFAFFTQLFCGKTHIFKICALKKRNDFRPLKKYFRVEKCKTEENQNYWITWPIRLWLLWGIVLWKELLCKTWIMFILIKCICFIIKINHVWSSVKKHCFLKKTLFSKKNIVFQHVHFFIPLFSNEKLSLNKLFAGLAVLIGNVYLHTT